ncbi:hypothetical protein K3728_14140 [Rhodobacteraceae bacterium M385]|nr:hypothetical protein K3728_14140 [Rhodobacteraceae bacterium M385]
MASPESASEEAREIILGIYAEFAQRPSELFDYFEHAGFDASVIPFARDLPAAWLGFYRIKPGIYDLSAALEHLHTWPPIAAEIERRLSNR